MAHLLLTGFQPYGGRSINPTSELVRILDGAKIDGHTIRGVLLPVSLATARIALSNAVQEYAPAVIISTGLWPGEPLIRIERTAVNRAAFEIADNDGNRPLNEPLEAAGPDARFATLPTDAIVAGLRSNGIPARASDTAGTFLCNAMMFHALGVCRNATRVPLCGFIHVPYLPNQVAGLLEDLNVDKQLELHQRADLASMSLEMMRDAVTFAMSTALNQGLR
jgi:pyroglutamyl-peptidase